MQSGITMAIDEVSDPTAAMRKVAAASDRVGRLNGEIDLVGSDEERVAAKRLRESVWALASANGNRQGFEDVNAERAKRIEAAGREHNEAREAFREAARRGLVPTRRRWRATIPFLPDRP